MDKNLPIPIFDGSIITDQILNVITAPEYLLLLMPIPAICVIKVTYKKLKHIPTKYGHNASKLCPYFVI